MNTKTTKKLVKGLCVVGLLVLGSAQGWAYNSYSVTGVTPYDRQMAKIQPVLSETVEVSADSSLSLSQVNRWMRQLNAIPYQYSPTWQNPDEISSGTDCKGKAVALYDLMKKQGATNIQLVIGKLAAGHKQTHAWVVWVVKGTTYILDPTFSSRAWEASQMDSDQYIPEYAYSGTQKFHYENS